MPVSLCMSLHALSIAVCLFLYFLTHISGTLVPIKNRIAFNQNGARVLCGVLFFSAVLLKRFSVCPSIVKCPQRCVRLHVHFISPIGSNTSFVACSIGAAHNMLLFYIS
jgi:hypothetical protein